MANAKGTIAGMITAIAAVIVIAFGMFGYYVTGAAAEEAREAVKPVKARVDLLHSDVEAKIVTVDDKVDLNTTNIAVMTSRLDSVIVVIKEQNMRMDKIIDKL